MRVSHKLLILLYEKVAYNPKKEEMAPEIEIIDDETPRSGTSTNSVQAEVRCSLIKTDSLEKTPTFDRRELVLGPLLGQGGFCEVFEIKGFCQVFPLTTCPSCTHGLEACPSDYALKRVRQDRSEKQSQDDHQDLLREASTLAQLDHPHILKSHGFVPEDSSIILDRLDCTLQKQLVQWRSRLKREARQCILMFPGARHRRAIFLKDRLRYACNIASAVLYLHSKHIVHRDIKSSNIGFGCDGFIKLFDFGLSRTFHVSEGTFLSSMMGSPRYIAPEIVAHLPYTDACDVFSFTIVLWEILSCERAFARQDSKMCLEWRGTHREERPLIDHHLHVWSSHALRRLVRAGWQSNPSKRPSMVYMYDTLLQL